MAAFAAVFLAPLALTPHLLFYYDITPKVALLLLGAAIALALTSQELDSLLDFCGTRYGRWYAAAAVAAIVLAGVTTRSSAHPALAWNGATWRRMGALTQCAEILAALWIAAYAVRSQARVVWLLRAMCAAGLLASLYGIAQYFGWDPLLPKAGYEAGEGIFRIVRPPGTLGHSDYFAAFLLWPVFAGIALLRGNVARALLATSGVETGGNSARMSAWAPSFCAGAAAVTGIIAIVLSGSRGAWLALIAGLCVLAAIRRPSRRTLARGAAFAALALAAFYFSPAGERFRARLHWIGEDTAGGARPLLWRDSLRMAAAKPLTGFGLDTFSAEFPHYQSEELERAYPDFSHESPHNMFLDTLTSEGVPGLLLLAAVTLAGIVGGWRARLQDSPLAAALLPAFAASLVAHQFVVFVAPTAFYFYLGAGILAGAGGSETAGVPAAGRVPATARWAVLAAGLAAAGFLAVMAYRMVAADSALALVERRLDANDAHGAAAAYRQALQRNGLDVPAELYFSRRWATVSNNASDTISRLYYGQVALGAAGLATKSLEQQQNAWYNLAIFEASTDDAPATEHSLRAAIAAAPVWYKPHWALARLLASEGRLGEAEPEARRALYLDGGKDAEVASTMNQILRSAPARP